jgi:hypothetical protein
MCMSWFFGSRPEHLLWVLLVAQRTFRLEEEAMILTVSLLIVMLLLARVLFKDNDDDFHGGCV